MPRDNFEKELRLLNRELILMASECETLIAKASRVVMKGEMDLIDTMPDEYQALLEKENSVSHLCQHLFILQQPVARDCDFNATVNEDGNGSEGYWRLWYANCATYESTMGLDGCNGYRRLGFIFDSFSNKKY